MLHLKIIVSLFLETFLKMDLQVLQIFHLKYRCEMIKLNRNQLLASAFVKMFMDIIQIL